MGTVSFSFRDAIEHSNVSSLRQARIVCILTKDQFRDELTQEFYDGFVEKMLQKYFNKKRDKIGLEASSSTPPENLSFVPVDRCKIPPSQRSGWDDAEICQHAKVLNDKLTQIINAINTLRIAKNINADNEKAYNLLLEYTNYSCTKLSEICNQAVAKIKSEKDRYIIDTFTRRQDGLISVKESFLQDNSKGTFWLFMGGHHGNVNGEFPEEAQKLLSSLNKTQFVVINLNDYYKRVQNGESFPKTSNILNRFKAAVLKAFH